MIAGRPETFRPAEVAAMIGVAKSTVQEWINAGVLGATRVPRGRGHQYRVSREHLTQFLVGKGFPLDRLRRVLNPDGAVALCRTPPALHAELVRKTRCVTADSLFELGRLVETTALWAVVVNLPEVGTSEAFASLLRFHQSSDRPEIVGLYGEDGLPTAAFPLDAAIPAAWSPAAVARSVLSLRS